MTIEGMLTAVARFHETVTHMPIPPKPEVPTIDRCNEGLEHLQEEIDELRQAYHGQNVGKAADALIDLIYLALGRLLEMGVLPGPIFDEVHAANMRKVSGSPAKRGHQFDAKKPLGWKGPDIEKALAVGMADVERLLLYRAVTDAEPGPSPMKLYEYHKQMCSQANDLFALMQTIADALGVESDGDKIVCRIEALKAMSDDFYISSETTPEACRTIAKRIFAAKLMSNGAQGYASMVLKDADNSSAGRAAIEALEEVLRRTSIEGISNLSDDKVRRCILRIGELASNAANAWADTHDEYQRGEANAFMQAFCLFDGTEPTILMQAIPVPPEVQTVAMEGHHIIADRMSMYGSPKESWDYIGAMWTVYLRAAGIVPKDGKEIDGFHASNMMIEMKTIRNAYSYKRDNFVDVCGYAVIGDICATEA